MPTFLSEPDLPQDLSPEVGDNEVRALIIRFIGDSKRLSGSDTTPSGIARGIYFEQMQNIAQCTTSRRGTSSVSFRIDDQNIKFVFPSIPEVDDGNTIQYLQDTTPDIFLGERKVELGELNTYLDRIIRDADPVTSTRAARLQEMLSLGLHPFKVCKSIMARRRQ